MRPEEAKWIGEALGAFPNKTISPMLELGACTRKYRTIDSPHIDRYLHRPLQENGVEIVYSDAKSAEGVDIVGDIYDLSVKSRLMSVGAKCVLCCNMFEHIPDRPRLAAICDELLQPGGILVVSVPRSYPYHRDPIDTYFRPSPSDIAAMFPAYSVKASIVISSGTYLSDVAAEPNPVWSVIKKLLGTLILYGGLEDTKARAHCLLWSFRPYKVSVVVLGKPGAGEELQPMRRNGREAGPSPGAC